MFSVRSQIISLIQRGNIPAEKIDEALTITGINPDAKSWRLFIDQLLLWLGGLSLAFAAIFFIAYNWSELGRFAKFGLVQALIVIATTAYWKLGTENPAAKLSLLVACIFLGVLLALYGQTYQTGADPWQLFFSWAILILPWALLGRFTVIWVLWLVLLNLAIFLYYQTFRSFFWLMFDSEIELLWLFFGINTCSLLIWELIAKFQTWLSTNWAERLLATASGVSITWIAIHSMFSRGDTNFVGILVWIAWLVSLYFYYRKIKPELFMLAGLCTSAITIVITFLAHKLLDDGNPGGFLFIALLLIGMGTAATFWLRNIHRELQS
ncbi:MAG: DUF2157 domain-containing protein [Gammaproteobacteria bacterium]|nr:DUF2157 domain-containing protein [Gammaproteobacteria bacterium]